jgi:hypothetical protein
MPFFSAVFFHVSKSSGTIAIPTSELTHSRPPLLAVLALELPEEPDELLEELLPQPASTTMTISAPSATAKVLLDLFTKLRTLQLIEPSH